MIENVLSDLATVCKDLKMQSHLCAFTNKALRDIDKLLDCVCHFEVAALLAMPDDESRK